MNRRSFMKTAFGGSVALAIGAKPKPEIKMVFPRGWYKYYPTMTCWTCEGIVFFPGKGRNKVDTGTSIVVRGECLQCQQPYKLRYSYGAKTPAISCTRYWHNGHFTEYEGERA